MNGDKNKQSPLRSLYMALNITNILSHTALCNAIECSIHFNGTFYGLIFLDNG